MNNQPKSTSSLEQQPKAQSSTENPELQVWALENEKLQATIKALKQERVSLNSEIKVLTANLEKSLQELQELKYAVSIQQSSVETTALAAQAAITSAKEASTASIEAYAKLLKSTLGLK